ncbi:hypothetical protein [Sphingobacterium yanglingense]|uniref:Lipoprotein n=1 Tax=Sphingobacterium yanglingense TaxID=1437280 RepID=A0A4R6WMB2_9SPHI|nr:hypothetical protein [Sphingobacterium yanglingense]TDQ79958.1 hypothetical protein CLV99_1412 [Sphingobacterium yanglingense]
MGFVFKGFFFMLGLTGLVVGCNSSGSIEQKNSLAGDYLFLSEGDTISLALQQQKDSVFGELKYAFSGKDRNVGKINGTLKDSLITGDYSFVSEGVPSVRQVVFRVTDQGLVEGYGEIEESNGKMIFSDKDHLSFDHGMILQRK